LEILFCVFFSGCEFHKDTPICKTPNLRFFVGLLQSLTVGDDGEVRVSEIHKSEEAFM
jgi:hypothetical protein